MSNKLIRAENIRKGKKTIFRIEAPEIASINDDLSRNLEIHKYDGPSVEEVQDEINKMRQTLDEELRFKRRETEEEHRRIIKLADSEVIERVKNAEEQHKKLIADAATESKELIEQTKIDSKEMLEETEKKKSTIEKESYDKGYIEGLEKAFVDGKEELNAMLSRLERILGETINKRNEIIESSEKQLINIATIIAKKVVKGITQRDQSIVLRNVNEALTKVKGRGRVTIRVNLSDLPITTRHKNEFHQMLKMENVNILEDPTIEKGGCIIETDFGDVDARIESQLDEIETAVKNIQPIRGL